MNLTSTALYADWLGQDFVIVTDGVANTLALRLTNISGETIKATSDDGIRLFFPVGDDLYDFIDAAGLKSITCTPPFDWSASPDDSVDGWIIKPQDSIAVESGESVVVVFDGIEVTKDFQNGSMSCLSVAVVEDTGDDPVMQLPVFMKNADAAIRKFVCSGGMVGILDTVSFAWETMGGRQDGTGIRLLPDFSSAASPRLKAIDTAICTVVETTDYSLCVSGKENSVIDTCSVYVFEPEIVSFTYAKNGTTLTLSITLKNTCHCYIGCGVGRIDCIPDYSLGYCLAQGTVTVSENASVGVYKISCLGKDSLIQKTLRVPTA